MAILLKKSVFRNVYSFSKLIYFRHSHGQLADTTPESEVIVDRQANITTIGLNLPDVKNEVNCAALERLTECIQRFEADESSPLAVLHGVGGSLCTGLSLHSDIKIVSTVAEALRCTKKPIIAAVTGFTTNFGFQLALLCDLRVMEDTALFGFSSRQREEPISPLFADRLVSMVGLSRSLDFVLTGRNIKAKEAFELGLANRIVQCGTGLGQSVNLAKAIAKFPQDSALKDRDVIYKAFTRATERTG